MRAGKYAKKMVSSYGKLLYWMVGILLTLTMLTVWMVSGLFAKYTTSGSDRDTARVADGLPLIEIKEHEAELKSGVYVLKDGKDGEEPVEVTENTYAKVIPGVDIAKDPFIRLTGTTEVDFVLYLRVTEKDFPAAKRTNSGGEEYRIVDYSLTDEWELDENKSDTDKGVFVYKYKVYFDAGSYDKTTYPILKDNQLIVSQYYEGDKEFTLSFEAWIQQVD